MPQTLYCSPTSPYARRVRLSTRLLGLSAEIEEHFIDPYASPTELLVSNPLSKIPVLRGSDGLLLPDSRLIMSYLLRQKGQAMPDADGDWQAARNLVLAEGVIEAAVAIVMENLRPESIRYPAQIDRQRAIIARSLDALADEDFATQAFASGQPTAVTLASALAYLDFRLAWLCWRDAQPALAARLDALAEHPAMVATAPPAGA